MQTMNHAGGGEKEGEEGGRLPGVGVVVVMRRFDRWLRRL